MKKAIFFIEGVEHLRFVEPYINSIENSKYNLEITSFEELGLKKFKTKIINKKDFNKYCLSISAEYLITTTPGVGNLYFQKSKIVPKSKRPKYVYLFHSLVSPNEVYSKKSFSGFDYIFSPNEITTNQLSYLTNKQTEIFTTGYPLLTNNYYFQEELKSEKKNILIAPSWGKFNIFQNLDLLKDLLNIFEKEYEVHLRPHPMDPLNLNSIDSFNNVNIDFNKDMKSLYYYDFLITDWSGIGIEYSILTNRKTLYLNTPKKSRRRVSFIEKKLDLIEDEIRKTAGIEIQVDNLNHINKFLESDIKIVDYSYINQIKKPKFSSKKFENLFK